MTKTNPTEKAGKSPNPAKNETKAEHAIKEQAKHSALPEAEIKTPDSTNTPAHEEHDLSHPLISPLDGQRIAIAPQKRKARHGFEYDAVVLGAGPAGEAAAMKLAKSGLKVAVIDPRDQVGGNCAHVGTIPSKALRQSVFNIISMRRDPIFSSFTDNFQVPLNKVLSKARRVIASQVNTHKLFYERNRVEIIQGWGRFMTKTP